MDLTLSKRYNDFWIDWEKIRGLYRYVYADDTIKILFNKKQLFELLDLEQLRFQSYNQDLEKARVHFVGYLKLVSSDYCDTTDTIWKSIIDAIFEYCEQTTEPQQSEPEVEPTPSQIEKLRYLHLSGLLPHLIEQHKRIRNTNPPTANWDSVAHVVSRIIGEPVSSIRKTIREHYTNLNQRLEDFHSKGGKSKEEVLGFLKAKKVRD